MILQKTSNGVKKENIFIMLFLVFFVVVLRMIPHLPNFIPVTAVVLMAGVYFGKKWAIILPIAGLLLSDIFIGFYELPLMLSVYGSFMVIGIFSWWLRKNKSVINVFTASIFSSLFFFLITNFAVWMFSSWYAKDLGGLLYCFEMAIPFFRYALIGDLLYTMVLFGGLEFIFAFIRRRKLARARQLN